MNQDIQPGMQRRERALDHSEQRHRNAEEDRIRQHGEYSLGDFALCGRKEDRVLSDQRQSKARKELQILIGQHKFSIP